MNTIQKAAIYCRVSTKEQAEEGGSLATQEKICRDYAERNGYVIAGVFIEQGESAKTMQRTEFQRMLDFCRQRKNGITTVIAYKIDRIARNFDDYSYIRILLRKHGIEIKSTSENFGDTPAGKFMENMIANVSQFDNDVRTERTVNGMKHAIQEGRYLWKAPVGYTNDKIDGKSNIVPNEMAGLVRRLFELAAMNQFPLERLRQQMATEGLVNENGKPIARSYFYRILQNETYTGYISKLGLKSKGSYEPLIQELLFQKVQRVLKRGKDGPKFYAKENPDFPLRRFVLNTSGNFLTGGWCRGRRRKYAYYWFANQPGQFSKESLEKLFMEFLDSYKLDEAHYKSFKEALHNNFSKKNTDGIKSLKSLQEALKQLEDEETELIKKNRIGVISDNVLQRQLSIIETETARIQDSLMKKNDGNLDIGKVLKFGAEFLNSPGKIWESATPDQKLRLQWFKFPLGVVFDEKIFRTTEICNVFKAKTFFFDGLSSKGYPRNFKLNTPKGANFKKVDNKAENVLDTMTEELHTVYKILKNIPEKDKY